MDSVAARRDREHADAEMAMDAYKIKGMADVRLVLDVGAYHGSFTRLVNSLYPTALVHAFEPNPDSYARLTKTASGKFYPVAVGISGVVTFRMGLVPSCSAVDGAKKPQRGELRKIAVKSVNLSEFIANKCKDRVIDILKIDCEGCEAVILESLSLGQLRGIYYITGEWHGQDQIDRVVAALSQTHTVEVITSRKKGHRGGYFHAKLDT